MYICFSIKGKTFYHHLNIHTIEKTLINNKIKIKKMYLNTFTILLQNTLKHINN
jgi:hypothetical protein